MVKRTACGVASSIKKARWDPKGSILARAGVNNIQYFKLKRLKEGACAVLPNFWFGYDKTQPRWHMGTVRRYLKNKQFVVLNVFEEDADGVFKPDGTTIKGYADTCFPATGVPVSDGFKLAEAPEVTLEQAQAPDKTAFDSADKNQCNAAFADAADSTYTIKAPRALVLDDAGIKTSKALMRGGLFNMRNIAIPNFDERAVAIIRTEKKQNVHHCSLNALLQKLQHQPAHWGAYSAVFLDYCATWSGNKELDPSADVDLLFDSSILAQHSTLAITIARRKERTADLLTQADLACSHIGRAARRAGLCAIKERTISYRSMVFMLFSIKPPETSR